MGMLTSMYSGVAGLNSHGRAMSSVADNIANVSTHGFKATRTNFGDVMVQSLSVGGSTEGGVGSGSQILSVQNLMTQGSSESTDISTDLAINGNGFFQLNDPNNTNTASALYYSRAGQFLMDKEGYLVNPSGYRLQGYNLDSSGEILETVDDIQILVQQSDATATSQVDMSINLDAEDDDLHLESQPITPSDQGTWNYLTPVRVYDSLGVAHDISLFFQHVQTSSYSGLYPTGPDGDVASTDITGIWKVSAYETVGDSYSSTYLEPPQTFFMHFDTDGHLVGTSTGIDPSGDKFSSQQTFTGGSTAAVSDRVNESFTFDTPQASEQEYVTSYTVAIGSTWNASGDTFTVGSFSYTYDSYGSATDLVSAINSDARNTGIWADLDTTGTTAIVLYGDGETSGAITYSSAISTTGTSLGSLVTAINSGDSATAAVYVDGGAVSTTISMTIGSTAVTIPAGYTVAQVATTIDSYLEAATGGTWTWNAIGDSIFFESTSTGTSMNASITSSNHNVISGMKNDAAAGGMDDSTTHRVSASIVSNELVLDHLDTGTSATIDIDANNSMGNGLNLNFDSFTQDEYANEGDNTVVGTNNYGEQDLTWDWKDLTGASDDQEILFDFSPGAVGTASSSTGSSASASTQSAGESETFYLYQDGSPRGTLESLEIGDDGVISGRFSNGTLQELGAVVLADFQNPSGLQRYGDNLWQQTLDSGEPVLNYPGSGGTGTLEAGALEQSNVDLADQFVKMIAYQRAFQANSRTISTTDEMLAELLNLKR